MTVQTVTDQALQEGKLLLPNCIRLPFTDERCGWRTLSKGWQTKICGNRGRRWLPIPPGWGVVPDNSFIRIKRQLLIDSNHGARASIFPDQGGRNHASMMLLTRYDLRWRLSWMLHPGYCDRKMGAWRWEAIDTSGPVEFTCWWGTPIILKPEEAYWWLQGKDFAERQMELLLEARSALNYYRPDWQKPFAYWEG